MQPTTNPLMELTSDGLARHQAALAHQESTLCIECGDSEHDLLRSIFEHPLLTLFEKA
jgi:hypothetical protein